MALAYLCLLVPPDGSYPATEGSPYTGWPGGHQWVALKNYIMDEVLG